jgi:dipeptidyl aminopeptidase/acylaminoacyl peptidase
MARSAASLLFLMFIAIAASESASAQQRNWTVEDVLAMKSVGEAAISPQGEWIAYVVSHRDLEDGRNLSSIWLVGGDGGEPIQLTAGTSSDRSPVWAPDGSWLAFLSGRDGPVQVHGIRPNGGEAWKVTDTKVAIASFDLSPDGAHIAFTARLEESEKDKELKKLRGKPMVWDSAYSTDWTHLWVAPLVDRVAGESKRSSPDGLSVGGFVWAPDSRGLAWSGVGVADTEASPSRDRLTGFSRESDLYVQDAPGAPPRRVTNLRGGETPHAWIGGLGIVFSGTGQALGTFNRKLWLAGPDGGASPVTLTQALDENATLVAASPEALLVEAQYRTGSRLYRIALNEGRPVGEPQVISDDRLLYSGFSATRDTRTVAMIAQGPAMTPNVHVTATQGFAPRRLTDLNPAVAALALGEQRVVRWKSEHDGEEIEGVLTLPVGYRSGRVPLLLIIHGGPSGVSSNGFNPGGRYPAQVFAGLGFASLQPNYRGSTAYGERFRGLNRGHISGHDWIDVNSGVDHLVREGVTDADRLGIMGWSFGGHHTFWGITQTDRFKAASAGAGANDLISMYSQTDLPGFYHTYLGPRPWEDFDLYEQRSAYRFVDRVTTPLLIQVGQNDERVPAEQSIQFYEAMTGIGKAPAKLIIYPGEGHGLRETEHIRDMMMRNIEWFTHWIPVARTATADGHEM